MPGTENHEFHAFPLFSYHLRMAYPVQGFRIYMVLTEVYKNGLCKGFDQCVVIKTFNCV